MKLEVGKCPSDDDTFTNCLIVNHENARQLDERFDDTYMRRTYVKLRYNGKDFIFAIIVSPKINMNVIGLNGIQRKWIGVSLYSEVDITNYQMGSSSFLASLNLEVDFLQKSKTTTAPYESENMANEVMGVFLNIPQTMNQEYFFRYQNKAPYLSLRVKGMEFLDTSVLSGKSNKSVSSSVGVLTGNTMITFDRKEDSTITLTGKAVGKSGMANIINPDWDFSKLGIGGLDTEFNAIFRRAFASRVFPPDLIEQLGMSHVKGILLHGPPGTGKTLMARQIGKMLNTREPKIVNGPEILNKYVGESEKNIRDLFKEAEDDQKKFQINSPLHMIIFDEIDAICKQRGTVTGSTGVADTVVNQLLSKIDGVEQLNNILIIGMTNRKDLIDEALLRPGRLEVQMEIGLPDEAGRVQILEIHTAKLKASNKLAEDVDLGKLAAKTKNYSGAEIEGLVRAASTTAMNRLIKVDGKVMVERDAVENLLVENADFLHGIEHDVKPKYGTGSDDSFHYLANGIIEYGEPVNKILEMSKLLINQARHGNMKSPITILLQGREGSGKTALAAHIAYKLSNFPCVKVCSPEKMIGYSEGAKCQAIKQIFDDACRSELSCVIVDDIERLLDYVPIGPRFSNVVLQSLLVLLKRNLKKGKRLMIIGTSSLRLNELAQLQLLNCFNTHIDIPIITDVGSLINVVQGSHFVFLEDEKISEIQKSLSDPINVSTKRLMSLIELAMEADEGSFVSKLVQLLSEKHE